MAKLTASRLKELLHYCPTSGEFIWLTKSPLSRVEVGSVAGSICGVYRRIRIDSVGYYAHRLAFLYMTGEWPTEEVDHINTDGLDNCWLNLRQCSRAENVRNRKVNLNSKTGVKGVMPYGAGYRVNVGGTYLGLFTSLEEAKQCAVRHRESIHGQFTNHG